MSPAPQALPCSLASYFRPPSLQLLLLSGKSLNIVLMQATFPSEARSPGGTAPLTQSLLRVSKKFPIIFQKFINHSVLGIRQLNEESTTYGAFKKAALAISSLFSTMTYSTTFHLRNS